MPGASTQQQPVLTVERLNIVDSAGNPALVLANAARLSGATFGHKEYPKSFVGRGRSAGMIFFNEAGDEVGGLIYEGAPRDSTCGAFGHLSFDPTSPALLCPHIAECRAMPLVLQNGTGDRYDAANPDDLPESSFRVRDMLTALSDADFAAQGRQS